MRVLLTLFISLSLIPVWLNFFLRISFDVRSSLIIGFFLTMIISYSLRMINRNSKKLKFLGSGILLIYAYSLVANPFLLYSPLPLGIISFLLILFYPQKHFNVVLGLIILAIIVFIFLYPPTYIKMHESAKGVEIENILDHQFVSGSGDTVVTDINSPLFVAITWNEYCGNCKPLIRAVEPLLLNLKEENLLDFGYVYCKNQSQSVVSDPYKEEPYTEHFYDNLLIDHNNTFYPKSKMTGVPYFMIFNNAGAPLYYFHGYDQNFESHYVKYIREKIYELKDKEAKSLSSVE